MHRIQLLLATLAASLVTMIAVFSIEHFSTGFRSASAPSHASAPAEVTPMSDDVLGSPVVRYQSDSLRYVLTYPGTWNLDDTHTNAPLDTLSDARGTLQITITRDEATDTFLLSVTSQSDE